MPVRQKGWTVEISSDDRRSLARVALHGACVYSLVLDGSPELFFTSSKSSIEGPAAIRGGIPIAWPCFGPPPKDDPLFAKLKQHGFARIFPWTFAGGEGSSARFTLTPNDKIRDLFERDFELEYTVSIAESSLKTALRVTNPSTSETLPFQTLFHTYFRLHGVDDPSDPSVHVSALEGLSFVDKVDGAKESTESRKQVDFKSGEVDRVYASVPSTLKLAYGNGGIQIKTAGLPDAVVWNPHFAKSDSMGDMEAEGWKRFVCLEPGRVVDGFEQLKPGKSWSCEQTISKL